MNDGVEQEAYCVDKNVPLLALDLLARIVPVRINAVPSGIRLEFCLARSAGNMKVSFQAARSIG